jgi:hypothetical protein
MWWLATTLTFAWAREASYMASLQTAGIYDWRLGDDTGGYAKNSSVFVWHLFDAANGIDGDTQ